MSIKMCSWAFAVILPMSFSGVASAQENSATKPTIHDSMRALTGCLQKGDDEYVLLADDGGIWELKGNSVNLDGQIGHTVVITGVTSDLATHAARATPKGEHGGYGYMRVSKLTSVSDTCERNG